MSFRMGGGYKILEVTEPGLKFWEFFFYPKKISRFVHRKMWPEQHETEFCWQRSEMLALVVPSKYCDVIRPRQLP